jgi:hypothetical protein
MPWRRATSSMTARAFGDAPKRAQALAEADAPAPDYLTLSLPCPNRMLRACASLAVGWTLIVFASA